MFMFADDMANNTGWAAIISAVIAALASAFVMIWSLLHKNRLERESVSVASLQVLVDKQQKRIDQLEAHTKDQTDVIVQLHEDHMSCQVDMQSLYGYVDLLYSSANTLWRRTKKTDPEIDDLPSKPPRPLVQDRSAIDFKVRSLKQRTNVLQSNPPTPTTRNE